MPKFLSLDELLEREYEGERQWDEAGNGTWVAALLEEVPEERTEAGFYDAKPLDLVSLFAR
jgi:hypothetical protein